MWNLYLKWLISPSTHKDEVAYKRTSFLATTLTTTLLLSAFYYFFLKSIDYETGALVLLSYIAIHTMLLLMIKLNISMSIIGNIYCLMTLIGFSIMSYTSGGVSSAVVAWFIATKVSAFWYLNSKYGYFWSFASVTMIISFFIAETLGWHFPMEVKAEYYYMYSGVAHIGILIYYIIVLMTYEGWQNEAKKELKEQNDELVVLHEELQQQNEEVLAQKEMLYNKSNELESINNHINSSIKYAKRIQKNLMIDEASVKSYFQDAFIIWQPKDIISGDIYWCKQINEFTIIAAIDCTGHGVPGALMTVMANDLMTYIVSHATELDPSLILKELNLKVQERTNVGADSIKDGMDMALTVINKKEQTILFSGAKSDAYLFNQEGLRILKGGKNPIGDNERTSGEYHTLTASYKSGDIIYMASDGYQDQFGGEQNRKFLKKRFREKLEDIHTLPLNKQKNILVDTFNNWKGNNRQTDDIMVVGIKLV